MLRELGGQIIPDKLLDGKERQLCEQNLRRLLDASVGTELVFFVGAGVSKPEPTNFPTGEEMLRSLFEQLSRRLEEKGHLDGADVQRIVAASRKLGFEITLNDLAEISPSLFEHLFQIWTKKAEEAQPNQGHFALARWIQRGGIVLTTNYDCFIESAYRQLTDDSPKVRYWTKSDAPPPSEAASFGNWRQDLMEGGVLFKLHGSFESPESCLATVRQVGTSFVGDRAMLLSHILRARPVCFVGWRGADPDIPPLVLAAHEELETPSWAWAIWQGPNSQELAVSLRERVSEEASAELAPIASAHGLLISDATKLLKTVIRESLQRQPTMESRQPLLDAHPIDDLGDLIDPSSLARFLGIAMRRAGHHGLAKRLFIMAESEAKDPAKKAAALQERAHLLFRAGAIGGVLELLTLASKELDQTDDLHMRHNANFGTVSMSVVYLRKAPRRKVPRIAMRLPRLFAQYRRNIDLLELQGTDHPSVALHRALYELYLGRLVYGVARKLGPLRRTPLAQVVLQPFNRAKSYIQETEDIHLHSKVDVLSYRAVALAWAGYCQEAVAELREAERLSNRLSDEARKEHLVEQWKELEQWCPLRLG